jgi:hypothetical protein
MQGNRPNTGIQKLAYGRIPAPSGVLGGDFPKADNRESLPTSRDLLAAQPSLRSSLDLVNTQLTGNSFRALQLQRLHSRMFVDAAGQITRALLDAGARADARNDIGMTALEHLSRSYPKNAPPECLQVLALLQS